MLGPKASHGGQVGPRGPEASPQPLAAPLVALQVGNRALGLTPVLGDTRTAALLSGLLLCFESPPRSAQCQDRSQGPVLPGLCSSPQSPKLRVAEEWVGGSLRTSGQPAKQTPPRAGGLHTLSAARARAGPVLRGERGHGDTGFQEAVPGRERGQGAALQDQLGVSLHGLDWRQTGREQRTRTDTRVDAPTDTGLLKDQDRTGLGHTAGRRDGHSRGGTKGTTGSPCSRALSPGQVTRKLRANRLLWRSFTGRDTGPDSARVPWVLSPALVGQREGKRGPWLCAMCGEVGRGRPVKVSYSFIPGVRHLRLHQVSSF